MKTSSIELHNGELTKTFDPNDFQFEFFDFIQCIQKISDIKILDREIVETTFRNDLKRSLQGYLTNKNLRMNTDFRSFS